MIQYPRGWHKMSARVAFAFMIFSWSGSSSISAESLFLIQSGNQGVTASRTIAAEPFRIASDIGSIASTRDGKLLFVTHLNEERISVIDSTTGAHLGQLPVERGSFAVSPDGTCFTGKRSDDPSGKNASFTMWSWPERKDLWSGPGVRPMFTRFSPDGKQLAVLTSGPAGGLTPGYELAVLDSKTGEPLWHSLIDQTERASFPIGLAYVGNGHIVLSISKAGPPLRIYRAKDGESIKPPKSELQEPLQIASSMDAPVFLAMNTAFGFEAYRLDELGEFERIAADAPKHWDSRHSFRGADVSPDGKTFLLTTAEECRVYRAGDDDNHSTIPIRGQHAHFLADGRTAIVNWGSRLIPLATDKWRAKKSPGQSGHVSRVTQLAFSLDGKAFASTDGESVILWDPETGAATARILSPTANRWIESVAFHPTDSLIYANTGSETWGWDYSKTTPPKSGLPIDAPDPTRRRVMHMFNPPTDITFARIALDRTGRQMIRTANRFAGAIDLGPDLRQAAVGFRDITPAGMPPEEAIRDVVITPDGKNVIYTSYNVIRICTSDSNGVIREIKALEPFVSPDARLYAKRPPGPAKEFTIHNLETEAPVHTLPLAKGELGLGVSVSALAWSPDSTLLVGATYDQRAVHSALMLWDLRSGKRIGQLQTHRGRILEVAIHPNGQQIAAANVDGSIEFWEVKQLRPE